MACQRLWMKEALDKLLDRLASHQQNAQNQSQHHSIDIDLRNENTLPRPWPVTARSTESLTQMVMVILSRAFMFKVQNNYAYF